MSNATKRWGRAGIASLATTALVASGLTAFAGAASASEPVDFERIAGDNRYETSVEAAEAFGSTDHALLASGEQGHYVDALSANFLAGVQAAPILLTREDQLPASVKAHLESSAIDSVTIIGGELAVSAAVEAELEEMGITVNRVAGQNRFFTNQEVIEAGAADADETALIATGLNFPDALGAGPVAFAGKHPVGLTKTNDIPDYVVDALKAAGVTDALILGGELAVGEEVEAELEAKGINVIRRLEGGNREATSIEVANYAIANLGFSESEVDFASGRPFSEGIDALSGGPVSGKELTPILITVDENRAPRLVAYLEENCQRIDEGDIYGGPLALSTALEAQLEEAAECEAPATNQDFTVTPQEEATNTVSTTTDPNTNRGARTYTVTGLAAGNYDIALFDPARISSDDNGVVTFRDTEGTTATGDDNNQADNIGESENFSTVNGDPDGAVIETVNGADVTDAKYVGNVSPSNGTITFVVDSEDVDSAQPVIFIDADNDNQLDLDANNQPSEAFGVGGVKNWVPTEAAFGAFGVNVEQANKDANFFVGSDLTGGPTNAGTFYYDANDLYSVGGTRVTMAEFESVLSEGDDVSGNYRTDEAGVSEFNLTDTGPAAPTNVTATVADFDNDGARDDVRVTWTASATSGVQYDVKRVNTGGTGANDCTEAGVSVADNTNSTTVTDLNVPNGTYIYCVQAVQGSGDVQSTSNFVASNEVTVPGAADTADPNALDTELTSGATGFANRLDAGDVVTICFDEALQAPNAGDAIQVQDETTTGTFTGDVATLTNGQNATFALGTADSTVVSDADGNCPANQTLVITVTGAVADQNTAGNGIVEVPALITDAAGITDLSSVAWLPGSDDTDRIIDVEAGAEAGDEQNTVAPTASGAAVTGTDDLRLTFNEAVAGLDATVVKVVANGDDCADAAVANGTGTGFASDDDDNVIDVLLAGDVAAGTYDVCVGPAAVEDMNGNDNAVQVLQDVTFA